MSYLDKLDEFTRRRRRLEERDPEQFYQILSKLTGIPPEELKEKIRKATEIYVISEVTERAELIINTVKRALDESEKLESLIRDNLDHDDFTYEAILPILLNEVIPNLETAIEALSHALDNLREYAREVGDSCKKT